MPKPEPTTRAREEKPREIEEHGLGLVEEGTLRADSPIEQGDQADHEEKNHGPLH